MKGGALLFDGSGRQQVTVRDLSGNGVGVRTNAPPRHGEQVRVVISLDGKSWLDLRGVVRHVRSVVGAFDCGIDLSLSDPEVLGHVEAYVARASAMIASARQSKMYAERLAGAESLEPTLKPREEGDAPGTGRHRMVRDGAGRLRPVSENSLPKRETPQSGTQRAETGERRASSSGARRILRPTGEHGASGSGEHAARGRGTPQDTPKQQAKAPLSRRPQARPGTPTPERKTPSSRETVAADPNLLRLYRAAVEDVTGDSSKKKKKK
jgi:hypothetical protein